MRGHPNAGQTSFFIKNKQTNKLSGFLQLLENGKVLWEANGASLTRLANKCLSEEPGKWILCNVMEEAGTNPRPAPSGRLFCFAMRHGGRGRVDSDDN